MTGKIIIDSFAGGGGASTGIEMALGRSPDVAINHDAIALAMHAANHPSTLHLANDIWQVDPLSVMPGMEIGLLWASPDCKHFSKAKGRAPRDRNIRDLAWVVVDWAEKRRPDIIALENVEEFTTWGPVGEDGEPIKAFAGITFADWKQRLRRAGYRVEHRELRACDYGAPTIRKRLFVVARRDGQRIVWPKPTHGDPASPGVRAGRLKPWRTAADIIDWSTPCPSIFDTSAQIMARHGLRAIRPLAAATMARIAKGVRRYVLDAASPFLVTLTHGARTEPVDRPVRTVTGANRGERAVVAPALATFYGHGGGRAIRAADLAEPLRTVTVEPRHAVTAAYLAQHNAGPRPGAPGNDAREPVSTLTLTGSQQAVVAAHLASLKGADRRASAADAPARAVLAGGGHAAVVAAHIAAAQQGGSTRPAESPLHTITASLKDQNQVVGAFLAKYYGAGVGQGSDEPLHTVTVRERFGLAEAAMAAPPLTSDMEPRARAVAGFLREHGAWDDREFVTLHVDGVDLVIADIGMRMLTPRELFNAQGFPPDYEIETSLDGRRFTKSEQIGRAGNSVCPDVAAAIIAANCAHLAQTMEAAE